MAHISATKPFHHRLEQIQRCINARQVEIKRRQFPDPAHNLVVNTLEQLYQLLYQYDETYLARTIVRYIDRQNLFDIYIDNKRLIFNLEKGGRIRHKSRKHKSRKHKHLKHT